MGTVRNIKQFPSCSININPNKFQPSVHWILVWDILNTQYSTYERASKEIHDRIIFLRLNFLKQQQQPQILKLSHYKYGIKNVAFLRQYHKKKILLNFDMRNKNFVVYLKWVIFCPIVVFITIFLSLSLSF